MLTFEEILEGLHVWLQEDRRDESIKLAAEIYTKEYYEAKSKESKWISVFKGLPKEYGAYLILNKDGFVYEARYIKNEDMNDRFELEFFSHSDVTHWQPLPEAPTIKL